MSLQYNRVRGVVRVLGAFAGLAAWFLTFPVEAAISLAPLTATNPVGTNHTLTATVSDPAAGPLPGVTVTFDVLSGPNTGVTGTSVTNASGIATFTYTSNGVTGTDQIDAFYTLAGPTVVSNTVTKIWRPRDIPTLTDSALVLLALLLIGAGLFRVGALRRR